MSKDQEVQPLECPFCKSENLKISENIVPCTNHSNGLFIECLCCYLSGPVAQSQECAYKFWNDLPRLEKKAL